MPLVQEALSKALFSVATACGARRVVGALSWLPQYRRTIFCYPHVRGYVALTIDDGLCRHGPDRALVTPVRQLLKRHDATATFFVCSRYLAGLEGEAAQMLAEGHELANHLSEDRHDFALLSRESFSRELADSTAAIERLGAGVRWFRAPGGNLTPTMECVCREQGLSHALGDCYCNDFAVTDTDFVARTMLRQADHGSVCIMHMPERGRRQRVEMRPAGASSANARQALASSTARPSLSSLRFREHGLESLAKLLDGLDARGIQCVTLSRLAELAALAGESAPSSARVGARGPPAAD